MATEKLNEIYQEIYSNSPYQKMKESDLYKLWEQSRRTEEPVPVSFKERFLHFISDPRMEQILFIVSVLLIVSGIILLFIAGKKEASDGQDHNETFEKATGIITSIIRRQDGKKTRPYGLVEFSYNGFKYTQGFFMSDSDHYETGKEIPVFVNTYDPRKSQIGVRFYVEASPIRDAARWLIVIGIAALLCAVL